MKDELIDIFTAENSDPGLTASRDEAHIKGLWHRTSHIWIFNGKQEILLQKRSAVKQIFPGLWDVSSAGHIGTGESPPESAQREMKEEIGLTCKKDDLHFYGIQKQSSQYNSLIDNEFHYVYLLRFSGDIRSLSLQESEVEEIKFFHKDRLREELQINPDHFVPHGQYWFNIIQEVEKYFQLKPS